MGLTGLQYTEGQTPLDDEEKEGLLIPSVTTRGELDEAEQRNIEEAVRWTMERRKRFTADEVLGEKFILMLHVRMLSGVWKWAGTFRKTGKNLGVSKFDIGMELKKLLDDCKYWIANDTYPHDEIAVRFKHRLVSIHCFANGNGRHSRLMADIIIEKVFNEPVFTWGRNMRGHTARQTYIAAMKQADHGNIIPLLKFARS